MIKPVGICQGLITPKKLLKLETIKKKILFLR